MNGPPPDAAPRLPSLWIVGLFFGGGASPTGVLLDSLAVALSRRGYRVEAVAGRSTYGATGAGASGRFTGPVHRLYSGPALPTGVLGRLLSWLAFYLSLLAFACTRRLPDVVLVTTTPPLMHAALVLRRLLFRQHCRIVLWNQDTYPEILGAVGLLRPRGLPYRLLAAVESWAVRRIDRAVALDRAMAELLVAHGAPPPVIIPNWDAHLDAAVPGPPDELDRVLAAARRRYRYVLLYSGNYGWGHDLGPLVAWLRARPEQTDFFPLFVGGGEKWGDLAAFATEVGEGRAWAEPYLPRVRFRRLLDQVDFGLVTLEDGCAGLMSPSKIHACLAAGKPLIYLGPPGSNVADAIDEYGCGVRAGYDRADATADALAALTAPAFDLATMSELARRTARERHTEEAAATAFVALLRDLPRTPPRHLEPLSCASR